MCRSAGEGVRGSNGDSRNKHQKQETTGPNVLYIRARWLGWRLSMDGLHRDGASGNMFVNHHHECQSSITYDRDPLGRSEQDEHGSGDLLLWLCAPRSDLVATSHNATCLSTTCRRRQQLCPWRAYGHSVLTWVFVCQSALSSATFQAEKHATGQARSSSKVGCWLLDN